MKDITQKTNEVMEELRAVREEYLSDGDIYRAKKMDIAIAKLEEVRLIGVACEEVIKQQ